MTIERFYLISILLFGFGTELAATMMLGQERYDRIIIDPEAQSSGLMVSKRALPLLSSDPASNPYERYESQEIVVVENRKSGQRIEFKFNDRNFYFEQEKDDFAHKEIKLEDISTAPHGRKIRQGLVFLHAIITNLGDATDIEIDKIMPSIGYHETTLEMAINGRWRAYGPDQPKIYDFPQCQNEQDLVQVTREIDKRIPLDPSIFHVSMRAFEFHSNDYSDRPINPRVGKEISVSENRISLPGRSSVLVKWMLTFKGTATNDLDFLPRGVLPPSCATQASSEEHEWKKHKIFNNIELMNRCYQRRMDLPATVDNPRIISIEDFRVSTPDNPRTIVSRIFHVEHGHHMIFRWSDARDNYMMAEFERRTRLAEEEEYRRRAAEENRRMVEADNRRRAEESRIRFMNERFLSAITFQKASGLGLFISKAAVISLIDWDEKAKIKFNGFKTRLVGR